MSKVKADRFFDETTEQSQVKATIVAKYFWAWAKVIIPTVKKLGRDRIAYLDLFAGPGRYKDGAKSTPVMILERAIAEPDMRQMLVTIFNDMDTENTQSLESALMALPGIEKMRFRPDVRNHEVGTQIVQEFESVNLVPTLFFVDPWGYKGLSLRLINSVLKDWGCECIFFFNYNRINAGLNNPLVEAYMNDLFGQERADQLREELEGLKPQERELAIVEALAQALKDMGGKHVLPFSFRNERGTRTSHHLIFVSKHERGYCIMKEIMAGESTTQDQGVPSLDYNPALERYPTLFELTRPLDGLVNLLLETFAGQTLPMIEVFNRHHVGRRFIKKNYKDALIKLEQQGQITASPAKRRKGTFADEVIVTFPPEP